MVDNSYSWGMSIVRFWQDQYNSFVQADKKNETCVSAYWRNVLLPVVLSDTGVYARIKKLMDPPFNKMSSEIYIEKMQEMHFDLMFNLAIILRRIQGDTTESALQIPEVIKKHLSPYMVVDERIIHMVQEITIGSFSSNVEEKIYEDICAYDPCDLPWDLWHNLISKNNFGFVAIHGSSLDKVLHITKSVNLAVEGLSSISGNAEAIGLHGLGLKISTNENDNFKNEYVRFTHCVTISASDFLLSNHVVTQRLFFHEWFHAFENRVHGITFDGLTSTDFVDARYQAFIPYVENIIKQFDAPRKCSLWRGWFEKNPILSDMQEHVEHMLKSATQEKNAAMCKDLSFNFMKNRTPVRDFVLNFGNDYKYLEDDIKYIERLDHLNEVMSEQHASGKPFWIAYSYWEDYRKQTKNGAFDANKMYWSNSSELLARSFEVYACDRLGLNTEENGWKDKSLAPQVKEGDLKDIAPIFNEILSLFDHPTPQIRRTYFK